MANRNIQAKLLKMARARKKAPVHLPSEDAAIVLPDKKPWSGTLPKSAQSGYISSALPPNRIVIREYKERARGLALDAQDMASIEAKTRFKGVPPGRKEAKELALNLMSEERLNEVLPQRLSITLMDNVYQRTRMFFNSQKTCFILVHEDKKKNVTKTSISYGSKDRIIALWNQNKITWVELNPSV